MNARSSTYDDDEHVLSSRSIPTRSATRSIGAENVNTRSSTTSIPSSSSFDYDGYSSSSSSKRSYSNGNIKASPSFDRRNDNPEDEPGRLMSNATSAPSSAVFRASTTPRPPLPHPRSAASPTSTSTSKATSVTKATKATTSALEEVEKDVSLARSRSFGSGSGSSPALASPKASTSPANRDRPWRTNNLGNSPNTPTDSYSNVSADDVVAKSIASELTNRWAQYETEDLAEESRRATSNAVVDMATRFADRTKEDPRSSLNANSHHNIYNSNHNSNNISTDRLQEEGASLPIAGSAGSMPQVGSSTTDYVKGRLSKLMSPDHRNSIHRNVNNFSPSNKYHDEGEETVELELNDYDKVRSEAMKMLEIADSLENNNGKSPRNSYSGPTTGLFRSKGGGFVMRELDENESRKIGRVFSDESTGSNYSNVSTGSNRVSASIASIAGLDKFNISERLVKANGSFAIGSNDEEDPALGRVNAEYGEDGEGAERKSSWSSRYSVERQLMAITGGMDTTGLLNKMDVQNFNQEKRKSATGMYRASASAMDGSRGVTSGDENVGSSSYYSIWGFIPALSKSLTDTLWGDTMELNYDGTTQSLVRRERRRVKRRRMACGSALLVALACAVGVLVSIGNPRQSSEALNDNSNTPVTFYVIADEPYSFSNSARLTKELELLPSDAEFLIHLGNANSDSQSQCQEYGYERAANVLKESPVPVFVIPGDEDWAVCEEKDQALGYWSINFGEFEKNFLPHSFKVEYQEKGGDYKSARSGGWDASGDSGGKGENFAFLHKGVLFISVHIVEADTDSYEWTTRHERNVMWTKEKLSEYNPNQYHAIVIFGHAKPSSKQGEYFWPVVDQLKTIQKPVLYLHANSDGDFMQYTPFGEAENFKAVQLEKRGEEAPMRVSVGGGSQPFMFTRRDPHWDDDDKENNE